MFMTIFVRIKKSQYENSNALVAVKMKYEMGSDAIEEFVGVKTKIYLILESNSSEY